MTDHISVSPSTALPLSMKAWQVSGVGEPRDVMSFVTIERPDPASHQVLIGVGASVANFPDVLMCRGTYQVRPDLPFTPGVEACGVVASIGAGVKGFKVGDRVLGGVVNAQAAALYTGYQTSWFALKIRAALQPGETLLVHARLGALAAQPFSSARLSVRASSGVVGNATKAEVARAMGADIVIDRSATDFVAIVNEVTEGRGADVVFDPVGGETYQRSTKCIAFSGRIVGFAGGRFKRLPSTTR